MKKYYVYVIDKKNQWLAAALSCPDKKTGERAYMMTVDKIDFDGNDAFFQSGVADVNTYFALGEWWERPTYKKFDIDDYEFAEKQTKKLIATDGSNEKFYIHFLRHVDFALKEQAADAGGIAIPPVELATEVYALAFSSGVKKLFTASNWQRYIQDAIAAISIGSLTDKQFVGFLCEYEKTNNAWDFRAGGHLVGFILKRLIPDGSVEEARLGALLGKKLELYKGKRSQQQEALDTAVRMAKNITGTDKPTTAPPVIVDESLKAPIFAAASGKPTKAEREYHKSKSIPFAEEPAEEMMVKNPKEISDPMVKTLEKTNELLEKQNSLIEKNSTTPRPVYYVPKPNDTTLDPQKCPIEGVGGFWESQKKYAVRMKLESSSLTAYRKTSEGARWSSDGTWGETKKGEHIFKKIDPSKPNSEFLYWVHSK